MLVLVDLRIQRQEVRTVLAVLHNSAAGAAGGNPVEAEEGLREHRIDLGEEDRRIVPEEEEHRSSAGVAAGGNLAVEEGSFQVEGTADFAVEVDRPDSRAVAADNHLVGDIVDSALEVVDCSSLVVGVVVRSLEGEEGLAAADAHSRLGCSCMPF